MRRHRSDPLAFRESADLIRLFTAVLLASVFAGLGPVIVLGALVTGLGFATPAAMSGAAMLLTYGGGVAAAHAASIFLFLPSILHAAEGTLEARRLEVTRQWVATLTVATITLARLSQTGHGPFALPLESTGAVATLNTTSLQLLISSSAVVLLTALITVGERREVLDATSRREEIFRVGFARSLLGQMLLRLDPDGLRIVELNGAAARMLGERAEALIGARLTGSIAAEDRATLDTAVADMISGASDGWRGEAGIPQLDVFRRVELAVSPATAETTARVLFTVQFVDVTARREAEERLAELALHDHLTGLTNRSLLEDRLTRALTESASGSLVVGVRFIDLDDFKTINDTAGHEVGDAVVIELASRLRQVVRANDTVARLGGDEFVVVSWSGLTGGADAGSPPRRGSGPRADPARRPDAPGGCQHGSGRQPPERHPGGSPGAR